MLIKFEIQLDGSGGATVIPAPANAVNSALPKETVLGSTFGAAGAATASPVAKKGGDAAVAPATGASTGASSSGPGTVFVIGPIVICGSGHTGSGKTGPGGDGPVGPIDP
jgi:hypothetical protein